MKKTQKKQKVKNKKLRKIVLISVLSVILSLVIASLVWYLTPKRMPNVDMDDVAEIYLYDGNSGLRTTFTEKEDIEYIITELQSTKYKVDDLALIFGTTFRLSFYDENGELLDHMILMGGNLIKRGIFFYRPNTPTDSLLELDDYFYDLLGCQWREDRPDPLD